MNLEYVQQALSASEYTVCLVGKNMMKRMGLRYLDRKSTRLNSSHVQ